jgi:tetratricopeptide (TPR) repeat protein
MMPGRQSGQVVLGRFRLDTPLGRDLWRAEDTREGGLHLLSFLPGEDVEASRARLLKLRDVEHPSMARISEVFRAESGSAVVLENVDGQPLVAHLEQVGPMPYRALLRAVEPVIRGVQAIHQSGLVHGEVTAERLLLDAEGRLLLLPPVGPILPMGDVQQLGNLMRGALTGNRPVDGDRELNDVPDRLWEGRTLPALLNQLVTDMCATHTHQRPAGTGEVLNRFQQIEKVIAEPAEIPLIGDPSPASLSAESPKSNEWIKWALGFGLFLVLAAMVAGAGFGFVYFRQMQEEEARSRREAERVVIEQAYEWDHASEEEGSPELEVMPAVDLVKLALQKAEAEEALDAYLLAKKDAESVGVPRWAEEAFVAQMRGAALADQAFMDKDYVRATEKYAGVSRGLHGLGEGKLDALGKLLLKGGDELKRGTSASATRVFETALLIDAANVEAQRGLQRAGTLDALNLLLDRGRAREGEKQWAFAHTDYAEAVDLDPLSQEARAGFERMKTTIAEEKFQGMMSRGLKAFAADDYDLAHVHLQEAKDFRPNRKEVDDALEMVAEGLRLRRIKALEQQAGIAEMAEDWPVARKAYLQVLEIDQNIAFAQEGKERVEQRITLMTQLDHYLARSQLLITPQGREAVNLVISDAEAVKDPGSKLKKAYEALNTLVHQANTEVKVTLLSDGQTEVTVYKVGKFGALTTKMLELLPGVYTVLGQRDGFKDVRHSLKLEPGTAEVRLEVICTERF